MHRKFKDVLLQILGWLLVVVGVAALVLPGPGLLLCFAGLLVLSHHYHWASRWLVPLEIKAMHGAEKSVQTWPRIALSTLFAFGILGFGVIWLVDLEQPNWWFLPAWTWLPGGRTTGVTLVVSGLIALGLIVWSFRKFRLRATQPSNQDPISAK